MNKRDDKFIKLMVKLAEAVDPVASAKIAAGIVIKGELISFGINQRKTHPMQFKFSKNPEAIYLHAEIDAIKNSLQHISPEDLNRATLYIARVKYTNLKKSLLWGLAKPCCGCLRCIVNFNVGRVVYTTDDCSYETL